MRKDIIVVTALCVLAVGTVYGIEQDARHTDKKQFDAVMKVAEDSKVVNDKLAGRVAQLEGEVHELRAENDDLRNRLSDAAERERARQVRASRSRRVIANSAVEPVLTGAWVHSIRGNKIANCESADLQHWPYSDGSRYLGGEKGVHLRDSNGHYGKWQFDLSTWRSVGGTGNPADSSEAEQDMRASRLYASRGEQPWACAHMV